MEWSSPIARKALAGTAAAISIGAAVFLEEPSSLLLAVISICICCGWKQGLAFVVACTALAAWVYEVPGPDQHSLTKFLVFVATAFMAWTLVSIFRTTSFFEQVYKSKQPTADDIPGLGWSAYPDGRLRFVNPAATEYIGISAEEMLERMQRDTYAWWAPFVHPDDVQASLDRWDHSLRTGEPLVDEQRVRRHDGTYRWFRDSAVASRDRHGNITGWFGTTVDIDDQRKAEAALKASEQKLRSLIDTVPALIWCTNPSGGTTYFNERLLEWMGFGSDFTPDSGHLFADVISDSAHPADKVGLRAVLEHAFERDEPFGVRFRLRRADGQYRWTDGKVQPLHDDDGDIIQWYGVFLDINDEVQANEAVRQSEKELQVLVDTVPSLIWLLTPEGQPCYFNARFAEWTGIAADAHIGSSTIHPELLHPDDRDRINDDFKNGLAVGRSIHTKCRLRRRDGQFRWIDSRAEPLRDQTGQIVRWYGVSFEIEEEVRAQAALKESERYLQHVIDTVPVGIVLADPQGMPVYVNKKLHDSTGLKAPRSDGAVDINAAHTNSDLVHPDDLSAVLGRLEYCYAHGESFAMRYRQRRADGVYRWIEDRSEPFRDDEGSILQWYGVNLDVDDEVCAQEALRLADERLARASRAASLSELSVSIAHELNQPLQAVVSNANAFQRWLGATPPNYDRARKTAEWIIRDADAAAEVINRIRALFSQSEHQREVVDLNAIVTGVCDLMADKLSNNGVKLEVDLDPRLTSMPVDRVQIEQVVLNLIRNSIEAMRETESLPRKISIVASRASSETAKVEVRDHGPGIGAPEKVFDAFYTTKKDGLGIGLAICRSIIEAHGGRLHAENMPDGGASVSFTLPLKRPGESDLSRSRNGTEEPYVERPQVLQ
ncbi:PAS domain-containing protein [Rhizobium sp. Root1220]|uniref:PAS domain-containing protein n=1 Tax=Rhizobium sp. Root1220 TaxID=1736432 RepID=UPI0006FF284D|nr:PAS domain-containing protein [Rhizobium sp. Root1220]KQV73263.1 hypothetical protein ASC90_07655 [Rhizobium sp. Root1220]